MAKHAAGPPTHLGRQRLGGKGQRSPPAGKTTVTALLLGFYDPQKGAVEVDVRTVTQEAFRRQVAVVLQDPLIFSATVADNIRSGRLDARDDEVRRAAVAVGADDFIRRWVPGTRRRSGSGARACRRGRSS